MRRMLSLVLLVPVFGLIASCGPQPTAGRGRSAGAMRDITSTNFSPHPVVYGWPGIAAFDYDNDEDIDIFVTNAARFPNMLYQNDGSGNFVQQVDPAGLAFDDDSSISVGVGDFDNDGWLDLVIGRQKLFFGLDGEAFTVLFMKNMGPDENGVVRFEDVTDQTGLGDVSFASSIGVGDIDNDGLLDLYIGRYNNEDLDFRFVSYLPDTPNVLMHNTGVTDGVPLFVDITESAGVAGSLARGLAPDSADIAYHVPTWAVYFSDVNADGLLDIFSLQEIPGGVDLFINNGDLTFTLTDEELLNKHGGWMGIASADVNRDGQLDYFLANVGGDAKGPPVPNHIANAWKRDNGYPFHRLLTRGDAGQMIDVAPQTTVDSGLLPPTNILGGEGLAGYEFAFGCAFFDMQNDGWPDLHWVGDIVLSGLIRNGPLRRDFHGVGRYLENNGDGTFADATAERGLFNAPADAPLDYGYNRAGRAVAAIDLNGDGFEDICRTNTFAELNFLDSFECFLNAAEGDNHWITIRLTGTQSNRFGIGARVEATAGDLVLVGEVLTTTSAFTAVHPQVHFGLGKVSHLDTLTIRWPSGAVTELADVPADRIVTIAEERSPSGRR